MTSGGWNNIGALRGRQQGGYSIAELAVVVAIIGILAASSAPFFVSYYQSAKLRAAAEDIAALVNQGRQLAIRTNNSVCVRVTAAAMQYRFLDCGGVVWVGAGSDAAGNVNAPPGITLSASADPVFSYLGNATPAASYTVTNTDTGLALHVNVAASGRVTVGP